MKRHTKDKDIMPVNDKNQKHGYFKTYWGSGFGKCYEGLYINDVKSGLWLWYLDDKINNKYFYI
jgi:hypothetical protein